MTEVETTDTPNDETLNETANDAAPADSAGALGAVKEERDRLKDQLYRLAADFDNFRKRTRKDLEDTERKTKEDAIREFLPVFDNLERALTAATEARDTQAIVEGIQMVLKMFEDTSHRMALERVASVGQPFDPNAHDAIQQTDSTEHPPGTIVSELVPGYRLAGRLLRPAMVVVARASARTGEHTAIPSKLPDQA